MAKVLGLRQQRVQFFFDTLFLSRGSATTSEISPEHLALNERKLFVAPRTSFNLSNMQGSGQLASDQTFLTYAIRHEVQFFGGTATAASGTYSFNSPAAVFVLFLNNTTFQYSVGEKVEFEGPISMTPAGGGPWGYIGDSKEPLINNGAPEARSLYVLPLPVAIVKRQGFAMTMRIFDLAGTSTNAAVSVVNAVNTFSGMRLCRSYIDGYHTRDVL